MIKKIEIKLSNQAKKILEHTDLSEEDIINKFASDGFTIGGRDLLMYFENK